MYSRVTPDECQYLCEITDLCQYFNHVIMIDRFENSCSLQFGVGNRISSVDEVGASFGHKYSSGIQLLQFQVITFFSANCTLGEEWAAWGECEPADGVCGNGTRERYKIELLPARNGGGCISPEQEECNKTCSPTGYSQLDF